MVKLLSRKEYLKAKAAFIKTEQRAYDKAYRELQKARAAERKARDEYHVQSDERRWNVLQAAAKRLEDAAQAEWDALQTLVAANNRWFSMSAAQRAEIAASKNR